MTMVLEKPATVKRGAQLGIHSCLDTSVAEIEASLRGISYPAQKRDLICQAKTNGASVDVMAFMSLLPEGKYHQFHDVGFMAWSFLII